MGKVAKYLNEHILGEVVTEAAVLRSLATDASVFEYTPEMVIYPRVTNDIRKVARFAWQLAEKGHILPLTARGGGNDETGGAISTGAIIATSMHMDHIFEYDGKQKLVRLQPGVSARAVNEALGLQGAVVPALMGDNYSATVGGAISYNTASYLSGRYGAADNCIEQLELVLSNGDILQTERLSKRDLDKKKGITGFEGDIYRKLDALIEDNIELIETKLTDVASNTGYSRIAEVKGLDGTFDLAPLIAGSQGTLGIISEMILKTEFLNEHPSIAWLTFTTGNAARDAVDELAKLDPTWLEYFDAEYFEIALGEGKHYPFYDNAVKETGVAALICIGFNEFSQRARTKSLKKADKIAKAFDAGFFSAEGNDERELATAREVTNFTALGVDKLASAVPLFDDVYVPFERFEDFAGAVEALAKKHGVSLPLYSLPLDGIIRTRPHLQLDKVSGKQKVFKLLDEYATIVTAHNGSIIGQSNEGRFKAGTAYKQLDDEVKELFVKIKEIFDPYGILNPGVKQPNEIKQLVTHLRSSYQSKA